MNESGKQPQEVRLVWSSELEELEIPDDWIALLERLLRIAAEQEGVEQGEVGLTFTDDEGIQALNRDYRGLDRPTDVLSFAMREGTEAEPGIDYGDAEEPWEEENELLGDIVISVPRAKAQSEEYGHSFERELGFLFVHGFLHLLGYDHQDETSEREMFGKQEETLRQAGLAR